MVARPRRLTRKEPFRALFTLASEGALVVHRDVVAKLPKELRLGARPMPFSAKAKGDASDREYVLLPVDAYAPLDRAVSELELAGKGDAGPWRGHVYQLTKLELAHPEGLPPLFRLVENPHIVIAREDVAKRLTELTKGDIIGAGASPATFPPSSAEVAPIALSEKEARAAHEAFWRLLAGKGTKSDRAAASKHPMIAVAIALSIDRKPASDTRKAACAHPFWAGFYALHVDRGARDDTRKAAHASVDGEVFYTEEVDLVATDGLEKRMLAKKGWWDRPSADGWMRALVDCHAKYRGGGAAATRLTTRDYAAAKKVPRYLEKKRKHLAPLSDELRSDVEAMTKHGHALLSLSGTADPSAVADAVHLAIAEIQAGERKIPGGKAGMQLRLGLACALADALHRAFGWQWASVGAEGVAAVVSPAMTHALVPLAPIARLAKKGTKENTVALLFNMIAHGSLPPKQKDGIVFVS